MYYDSLSRVTILNREEETTLLREYNDSSCEIRRGYIRKSVIESNLRLVFSLAKRYWHDKDPNTLAELIASGNEGLLLALNKYDPTYGTRFCTYAGHWVFMAMRKLRPSLIKVPQGTPPPFMTTEEAIPEDQEDLAYFLLRDTADTQYVIATWIRFLTDRERYIVENSYGINQGHTWSLRDLSRRLHLSSERIRQIKAEAVDKLGDWCAYHY